MKNLSAKLKKVVKMNYGYNNSFICDIQSYIYNFF